MQYTRIVITFAFFVFITHSTESFAHPNIMIKAMASGERQPILVRDDRHQVHQMYFKTMEARAKTGHLFYRRYDEKRSSWSKEVQVSTTPFRLPGVISRAAFAVDKEGHVHATWLRHQPNAYMYARSNINGTAFETERSLVSQHLHGFEVGAEIAVHDKKVTVNWMSGESEPTRTVYGMTSLDGGLHFGEEIKQGNPSLGGCSCCGFSNAYSAQGTLWIAYRSAVKGDGRHMQLLTVSAKRGATKTQRVHQWYYSACPVSTNDISRNKYDVSKLAFETAGKIYITNVKIPAHKPVLVNEPKQNIRQKYPEISINGSGYTLVSWIEGDGYASSGTPKMALFSPDGTKIDIDAATLKHLPTKSHALSLTSLHDDTFLAVYQPFQKANANTSPK